MEYDVASMSNRNRNFRDNIEQRAVGNLMFLRLLRIQNHQFCALFFENEWALAVNSVLISSLSVLLNPVEIN